MASTSKVRGRGVAVRSAGRMASAGLKHQHPAESNPLVAGVDFSADAVSVARALIGTTLVLDGIGGIIVETEAYDQREPAAHSYIGNTRRNAPLFGPPGRAYVYLSYGIHWCLNFVCREVGHGAGVLIRALEPTIGIPVMIQRRRLTDLKRLCSGPGRVGQALAVHPALNGLPIDASPFELRRAPVKAAVVRGPRIGITKAMERHWRFGMKGSPFVSRPFVPVARSDISGRS